MLKFKFERHADGTYTIFDVPVFGEVAEGVRGNDRDFDAAWHQAAVDEDARRRSDETYKAPLHLKHHGFDTVRRAGYFRLTRVGSVSYEGKPMSAVFADFFDVPADVFAELKSNNWPYRSVEILKPNAEPVINSIALLDTEEPFFRLPVLDKTTLEGHFAGIDRNTARTVVRMDRTDTHPCAAYTRSATGSAALFSFVGFDADSDPERSNDTLGGFIERERDAKDMSLDDMAKQLPIDASTLGGIETGKIERPPDDVLTAIAKAIGSSLEKLKGLLPKDKRDNTEGGNAGGDKEKANMSRYEQDDENKRLKARLKAMEEENSKLKAKLKAQDDDDSDDDDKKKFADSCDDDKKAKAKAADDDKDKDKKPAEPFAAQFTAQAARLSVLEADAEKRDKADEVTARYNAAVDQLKGWHLTEGAHERIKTFAAIGQEATDKYVETHKLFPRDPVQLDKLTASDDGDEPEVAAFVASDPERADEARKYAATYDQLKKMNWLNGGETKQQYIKREMGQALTGAARR